MYKKEIDSDVILNFSSVTPIKSKRSLILWFLNRAKTVSSSDIMYKQKIIKLKEKLANNGYPIKFFDDVLERFGSNNRDFPMEQLNISDFKNIIKIPYIGKPSME